MEIHPGRIYLFSLLENIHQVSCFLTGNRTLNDDHNHTWRKLSYPCFGTGENYRPLIYLEVSFSWWIYPLGHRKRVRCWQRKVLQDSCGPYRLRNQTDLGTARAVSFFVKRELETSLPVENKDLGSSIIMDIILALKKLDLGYITDQRFRGCLQWDGLDIGK